MHTTTLVVFIVLFVLVAVLGFLAARWRRAGMNSLEEWGLAGRQFGTFFTWFLLGGDLYTAYTFIAVPALIFGAGAIGFFAVPYTIVVYPFIFVVLPRFWSVSRAKGYVTAADFVKGRFDSSGLALAVAISGILATMPYIALQVLGMQSILTALGLGKYLPLVIAFAILAVYTYLNGLRAPAMVAIAKDTLIYITIIAALIIIPASLGGFGHVFSVANAKLATAAKPASVLLSPKLYTAYATLALGSAMALFFYPHAMTGVLASKSRNTVRKNAAFLPLYSLMLGGIALLGLMALAANINVHGNNDLAVPLLFLKEFSPWFVGVAFAAILIGALVPASVMSIAAANLFSRNIYAEYFAKESSAARQTGIAKFVSLLVMLGALVFILAIPLQFSLYLQTLGGVWILQTVPMIVGGVYTRWFHRTALLIGWLVGMVLGTAMEASVGFSTSFFSLTPGITGYSGIWALIANLVVVVILSLILNATHVSNGRDHTADGDYTLQEGTSTS